MSNNIQKETQRRKGNLDGKIWGIEVFFFILGGEMIPFFWGKFSCATVFNKLVKADGN